MRPAVPGGGVQYTGGTESGYCRRMNAELDNARKELDKEFEQVRKNLDKIRQELDRISAAGPEDDITEMLKDYEDQVKKVRTGGLIGSGAKGHREARETYLKLRGLKA